MVRGSERSRRLSPTIIHLVRLPLERQGCRDPERCGGGSHSATGAVLRETSCIRGAGTPVASQSPSASPASSPVQIALARRGAPALKATPRAVSRCEGPRAAARPITKQGERRATVYSLGRGGPTAENAWFQGKTGARAKFA